MDDQPVELSGLLPAAGRHALTTLLMRPYLTPRVSEQAWSALLAHRSEIESRLADLNLTLELDPDNEVAFTRQVDADDGVPKLLRRIPLGRDASLLVLWLRQEWAAADAQQDWLVVTRSQIEEFFHRFTEPGDTNEKRLSDRAESAISRLRKASLVEQDRDAEHLYLATKAIMSIIGIEQVQLLTALCAANGGDPEPEPDLFEPDDLTTDGPVLGDPAPEDAA